MSDEAIRIRVYFNKKQIIVSIDGTTAYASRLPSTEANASRIAEFVRTIFLQKVNNGQIKLDRIKDFSLLDTAYAAASAAANTPSPLFEGLNNYYTATGRRSELSKAIEKRNEPKPPEKPIDPYKRDVEMEA